MNLKCASSRRPLAKMAQKVAQIGQSVLRSSPALAIRIASKGADLAFRARPHLQKFWRHAKVEYAPPGPSDVPAIQAGISQLRNSLLSGKFMDKTVNEAGANLLVAAEIAFLFYIGEIIGRRSLIGYNPKV